MIWCVIRVKKKPRNFSWFDYMWVKDNDFVMLLMNKGWIFAKEKNWSSPLKTYLHISVSTKPLFFYSIHTLIIYKLVVWISFLFVRVFTLYFLKMDINKKPMGLPILGGSTTWPWYWPNIDGEIHNIGVTLSFQKALPLSFMSTFRYHFNLKN